MRGNFPRPPLSVSSSIQWFKLSVLSRRSCAIFCGTALMAVYDRSKCCKLRSLNICSGIPPFASQSTKIKIYVEGEKVLISATEERFSLDYLNGRLLPPLFQFHKSYLRNQNQFLEPCRKAAH